MTGSNEAYNPIVHAIETGDCEALARLFDRYPEALQMDIPLGGNWLNRAASDGTIETVEFFLGRGFDINAKAGSLNETALQCAAFENRCDIAAYLIDRGAQFDLSSSASNPLFHAMSGDALDMARLLLARGCDPRIKYDFGRQYGRPDGYFMDVFMRAREWGKLEFAKIVADWTHANHGYPDFARQEADFLAGYPK